PLEGRTASKAARTLAWHSGPRALTRWRLGVNRRDCVLVYQIYVDVALAVSNRKLRLATIGHRSRHFTGSRFDRRSVIAISVERKDPSGCRVIDDGVGISADADFLDFMKILEVEHHGGGSLPDRNKSLANIRSDRDAMNARGVRNRANDFAAVYVQYDHFRKMRDVHASSAVINRLKVPGVITRSERNTLENAIARAGKQRSQQEHRA